MKKLLLLLTVAFSAWSSSSFAWISKDATSKIYTFKFSHKGETFEVKKSDNTYEEAFEKAADLCFGHYKKPNQSENDGLEIIDVCANPRS